MNPPLTLASPYFGQPSPEGRPQEYRPDRHLLSAARLAYSLRRPLLLTGEPGCGKTDFAWVLADQLGKQHKLQPNERTPFICRVNSQTRAESPRSFRNAWRNWGQSRWRRRSTRCQ